MEKLKIKSVILSPLVAHIVGASRIWDLVDCIILEKWSHIEERFKEGGISKGLLKKISRDLADMAQDNIKRKSKNEILNKAILFDGAMSR